MTMRGLNIRYIARMPAGRVSRRALLLPSPCQSMRCWRNVVPELTRSGFMCVLCDLPGYGESVSRRRAPQAQAVRARYMWGVLDEFDLRDGALSPWHLIGQGAAAGTIAEMALSHPESVASLVMLNPVLYPILPDVARPLLATDLCDNLLRGHMRRICVTDAALAGLCKRWYGRPLDARGAEFLRALLARMADEPYAALRLLLNGLRADTSRLSGLFTPTMVICGGRDFLLGSAPPARLAKRDFPNAEYHVLRGGGHFINETHSRAVRDYLRGWIKALED